jgi:uncharacterized membrane protein
MEVLKVLVVLSLLPISSAYAGMFAWMWFWIALIAILGIAELVCWLRYQKTLSQLYWNEQQNKKKFMILAVVVVGICLIGHLIWKW